MKNYIFFILSSISFFSYSQNLINVPFENGFVGVNTGNNVSSSSYSFQELGWAKVQFAQNSTTNIFVSQGNDIIGSVLITDFSGIQHKIDGFVKWRAPSGSVTTLVFQPGSSSNFSLATVSSGVYNINGSSYIGLTFNGLTLVIPPDRKVSGNAATNGLLAELNTYLGSLPKINSLNGDDILVNENVGSTTITITLSATSAETITLKYITENNTAVSGSDFTTISGTIQFLPGELSKSISIPIVDDTDVEAQENFYINLFEPTNAAIIKSQIIVYINDNDGVADTTSPTITTSQVFTYAENQPANYTIGTVSATDNIGITGFSILSGVVSNSFSISFNGIIKLTSNGAASNSAANDFEIGSNTYTLTIQATDAAANTVTETITINVTDLDEIAPTITTSQVFTYAENQSANYAIGTVSATDNVGIISYTITSGNTAGYFAISPVGGLTLTSVGSGSVPSNDFETIPNSFTLVISATDAASNTATETITINLTDVSDSNSTPPPTLTITPGQSFSYLENQSTNYSIGTLTATNNTGAVSFSISSGNDLGYFAVSAVGGLTLTSAGTGSVASNDFETTPNSFTVVISATDTLSNTAIGNIVINVLDLDEITDTDGDGVPDSIEILDGTDPLDLCSYINTSVSLSSGAAWELEDCDNDGLINIEETELGTDPLNKDSDGDGVIDGTEITDKTDPLILCDYILESQTVPVSSSWSNSDCDQDGLSNSDEIVLGTDPKNSDSDGDGVIDGTEVLDQTNPLDPCLFVLSHQTVTASENWNTLDCDNDGLTNKEETALGTDPLNKDSDGDGVIDGTEIKDKTDPLILCDYILESQTVPVSSSWSNSDCDQDGLSNSDEIVLGTDPKNSDTDGDGVIDGTEVSDLTDPLDLCSLVLTHQTLTPSENWKNSDCDQDGLSNELEQSLGTDYSNPDSDGDGVIDGIEYTDNTNPLDLCDFILENQSLIPSDDWNNTDCDNDGITNGLELTLGTDPKDKDTDKDGVTDFIEYEDQTNPTDPCSLILEHQTEYANVMTWNNLDCDNDGLVNGGEKREDTDLDGLYNFADPDDDNDGILTKDEFPDKNGNSSDEDAMDVNNNNIPDYLEANNFNPNEIDGIEVYNVLTPNGDGVHDIFTIRNISMYPDNELRVYNRWGKLVYEMKGYGANGRYFNGTSNLGAHRLSSGTYFYVLNYRDVNAQNKTRQGYLYLNR